MILKIKAAAISSMSNLTTYLLRTKVIFAINDCSLLYQNDLAMFLKATTFNGDTNYDNVKTRVPKILNFEIK